MTEPRDADGKTAVTSRRRFLREGTLAGGAVLTGGIAGKAVAESAADAGNLPPDIPEWMKAPGDPTGGQLYGAPSSYEKAVVKNISKTLQQYISASSRTPTTMPTPNVG